MSLLNALILHSGQDLAGIGARYAFAARLMPERLNLRSVHISDTYIRYPQDLRLQDDVAAVRRLYDAADVIHLNNHWKAIQRFDRRQRKPVLYQHHGTMFRKHALQHLTYARRSNWESAVSTIDLLRFAPDVLTWLPAAYNIDELAALRVPRDDGVVRIAHAPTDRAIKSTAALIVAVDVLRSEGLPVELDLIERVPWTECLARKAKADIYFDQVILGYGCNAIESWAMGQPVIAGADPWTLDRMKVEFNGTIPFYTATKSTILDALRALVVSPDLRSEWAATGMQHALRFHSEPAALERLIHLYQQAIGRKASKAVSA